MVEDKTEKKKVNGISYVLYYFVLFFAYWFGSSRFDMDGDGDFDPEDVQAYLAEKGFLARNRQRTVSRSQSSASAKHGQDAAPSPEAAAGAEGAEGAEGAAPSGDAEAAQKEGAEEAGAIVKQGSNKSGGKPSVWDRDGDGDVDFNDFLETKVSGDAAEDIAIRNLTTGQVKPYFVLLECLSCFGLWLALAVTHINPKDGIFQTKGGLDGLIEGQTDLRFYGPECEDLRMEFWRWLSYQFSHANASHIIMNVFLTLMLGIPLEGLHGHVRMFIMFNVGVLGGACMNMLMDGHSSVIGCSGGCYALIGIHVADLMMNWREKKFRIPTFCLLVLMIVLDIGSNMAATSESKVSHAAHIGGAIAGLLISTLIGINLKLRLHEKIIRVFALLIFLGFVGYSVAFLFMQTDGPVSMAESMEGHGGWCWYHQVYNKSWAPSGERFYCVRCGTPECVEHFKTALLQNPVKEEKCLADGWDYDEGAATPSAGVVTWP